MWAWCNSFTLSLLILTQLQTNVRCACVCNEKGTNYCVSCNAEEQRFIVRPSKTKSYNNNNNDNYDLNLSPIGDNCWCSKLLIEPAAQPKPSMLSCKKHNKSKCDCSSRISSYSRHYGSDIVDYSHLNYAGATTSTGSSHSHVNDKYSQPADPVSVSLAIQAGKAINVPEAKLSYGFVQRPVDGLKKIYFSKVPEENLFKLNNDVITLKKRTENNRRVDEDIDNELAVVTAMEEDEEINNRSGDDGNDGEQKQAHLTYTQLGYIAERFKNPKFRRISSTSCRASHRSYGMRKRLSDRVTVDCGFKPGRISTYHKHRSNSKTSDNDNYN